MDPSAPSPSLTARWLSALTRSAFHRPWRFIGGALLILTLAGVYASRLRIRGDFVLLLPSTSETAQRFRTALSRKGSDASTLIVVAESPSSEANRRFVDAFSDRVRNLREPMIGSVEKGPGESREFFSRWRWLFMDLEHLERAECELEQARARHSPGYIDLGDLCAEESPASAGALRQEPPASPLSRLKREYEERIRELDRYRTGYFRSEDGSVYAVVIRSTAAGLGEEENARLLTQVRGVVAELGPDGYASGLKVGYAGDVPNAIAEREALLEDVTIVSSLAILLILGSIVLFFRSFVALLLVGSAMVLGTTLAFAIGMAAYGHLNAATSFLTSIIAGNGINHAILYLARYRERRSQGEPTELALVEAALTCAKATWLAALAGGGAYAALLLTSFRGFSEFGLIGGSGTLLCWAATFVVCPAAVSAYERVRTRLRGQRTRPSALKNPGTVVFRAVGNLGERYPKLLLAAAAAASVLLIWRLPGYLHDPWEYDFSKLSSSSSAERGAGYFSVRADRVFQSRGSPILVLADEMGQVEALATTVKARDRELFGGKYVENVVTIHDRLGGPPAVVSQKLELLQNIRVLLDQSRKWLSDEDRKIADEFRPPEWLRALTPADLPPLVRSQFTERDGTVGTPVYVYLNRGISQSKGHNLLAIAEIIDGVRLSDGRVPPNASRASVFAEMIRAMELDGPRCTLLAFVIVVLVALGVTRRFVPAIAIIGSMVCALLWTMGALARSDVKLNFLNFVALPLTFGIGVEYAINLFERIRLSRSRISDGVASVGGPVFLCSLTTTIGYGSLLFADNRALQSLGKFAIGGELASLTTAVFVLPAALALWQRRRARSRPSPIVDDAAGRTHVPKAG